MKLGIFGGSFDPIHLGHLILAERTREAAGLDEIWFVPAAVSPHKTDVSADARASDRQRMEMLKLAIGGHAPFVVSSMEIERGGVSYTIDTLKEMQSEYPDNELFLLIGGDSLDSFDNWKAPGEICNLAIPLVSRRGSSKNANLEVLRQFMSPERFVQIENLQFDSPLIEISSTEIRRRVSHSQSIRFLVPRSVEEYVRNENLYGLDQAAVSN